MTEQFYLTKIATLLGTTYSSLSETKSNGNEEKLYIFQSSRTWGSLSDAVLCQTLDSWGLLPSAEIQSTYSSVLADKAALYETVEISLHVNTLG